jgi:hypothetical protein
MVAALAPEQIRILNSLPPEERKALSAPEAFGAATRQGSVRGALAAPLFSDRFDRLAAIRPGDWCVGGFIFATRNNEYPCSCALMLRPYRRCKPTNGRTMNSKLH